METNTSNKSVEVLRWIAFLPGAMLAAWLAWILINVFGRFSLGYAGVEPDSFLGQFYFNTAGHAAMGAAFIYVGAKIVPSYRRIVAYILSGIGLVAAGFMLFPAIIVANWWAVWGGICIILGVGAVMYSIHTGETDIK